MTFDPDSELSYTYAAGKHFISLYRSDSFSVTARTESIATVSLLILK